MLKPSNGRLGNHWVMSFTRLRYEQRPFGKEILFSVADDLISRDQSRAAGLALLEPGSTVCGRWSQ